MGLKEKIESDFQKAFKEKKEEELSVLRMLKAALEKELIARKRKPLQDEDILKVLHREAKKRKEALELYKKGGREDLAKKEETERQILERYLPKKLSEEEVKAIVEAAIKKMGATTRKDLGKVMSGIMKEYGGQVEGKLVNQIAREILTPE